MASRSVSAQLTAVSNKHRCTRGHTDNARSVATGCIYPLYIHAMRPNNNYSKSYKYTNHTDRVHQRHGEQLVHVRLESLDCANNGKLTLNYLQFHGSKMCITLHSTTFLVFNTVRFTFSTRTAQETQAMHNKLSLNGKYTTDSA